MITKLHTLLHRLRPWAFPAVVWLILSVMIMVMMYYTAGCTPAVFLTEAVWVLLPWVLMPQRWRSWWLILPTLYTASLIANACVFRVFGDFIPVDYFFRSSSYQSEVLASARSILRPVDVIYPIGLIAIIVLWFVRYRRNTPTFSLRTKIVAIVATFLLSFAGYCFQIYREVRITHQSYGDCFVRSFQRKHCLSQDFTHRGYIVSYAHHTIDYLRPVSELTAEELAAAQQFQPQGDLPADLRQTFAANRGKNLIVVMVESLSSVELNTRINEVQLTPTLDSLMQDSTVLSLTDIQSIVGIGNSSDGQLMTLTGLAPAPASALSYTQNYTSLPSIIHAGKFASSHSFSGDSPLIWQAHRYLTAAGVGNIIGMLCDNPTQGKDEVIFNAALRQLRTAPQPFFAMVITVTMHPPYLAVKSPATAIADAPIDDNLKWFYQATRYTDQCIADFLAALKANGLYDNSVIVIVGDHSCLLVKDSPIPMFILNSGIPHRITPDRALTQLDIYATLLDVMGLSDTDYWPGMGQSALRPGLTSLTDDELYQRSILSKRLLENDYFRTSP
ncbi:MAG: LTA synthase family protein [Muribaculaceae bacterium]